MGPQDWGLTARLASHVRAELARDGALCRHAGMIPAGIYRHSKSGRLYRVHFTAKHSETLEDLVVYETLYDNPAAKHWVRPAAMFTQEVEVNGRKLPRFERVEEGTKGT